MRTAVRRRRIAHRPARRNRGRRCHTPRCQGLTLQLGLALPQDGLEPIIVGTPRHGPVPVRASLTQLLPAMAWQRRQFLLIQYRRATWSCSSCPNLPPSPTLRALLRTQLTEFADSPDETTGTLRMPRRRRGRLRHRHQVGRDVRTRDRKPVAAPGEAARGAPTPGLERGGGVHRAARPVRLVPRGAQALAPRAPATADPGRRHRHRAVGLPARQPPRRPARARGNAPDAPGPGPRLDPHGHRHEQRAGRTAVLGTAAHAHGAAAAASRPRPRPRR